MNPLDTVKEMISGEAPIEDQEEAIADADVVSAVSDLFDKYKQGRSSFERNWYRNLLYRHGNQWVKFDETEGRWRKRRLQTWVPTPVTNKFASTGERIASVISRIEPNWTFIPNTDSEADIVAANKADDIEPIICEENKIDRLRERIAKWLTYTGNCFVLSGVEDLNGKYKHYTDVFSPFETLGNPTIEDLDDQEAILFVCRRSKEYLKKVYEKEVSEEESRELGLIYLESLGYTTQAEDIKVRAGEKMKGVVVKIAVIRPNEKFPKGLFAVVAGEKVLDKSELLQTREGDVIFPVEQFKFDGVPGAFFAATPMHDLAPKQEQRNRLESLMELITMRMASPVWLIPEGTVVKGFTGEPGAKLKYHTVGDKNKEPSRIAGENIPNSLFGWLDQIDKDFEDLANTFEAMKGQTPYSGAPNVAIETLIEQGLTRFGPALRGISESYRRWMKTQIELFRIYGGNKTLVKMGDGQKWSITKFNEADFAGSVNVRVESDSTIPRNEHAKQTKLLGAIDSGLLDVQDPVIRFKLLQKFKLEDMAEDLTQDIVAAVKENEAMAQGIPIQVSPFLDNHAIHIKKHRAFAMSDAGEQFKQTMLQHIAEHDMTMNAEMTPQAAPAPGGKAEGLKPEENQTAGAMNPGAESAV